VVEFLAVGNDDGVPVRAPVAALRANHRRSIPLKCAIAGTPRRSCVDFVLFILGLLMNCLILGWVTKAMVNIISTAMGVSDAKALAICVFFLMPFTGIYVSLGWFVGRVVD